MADPPDHAADLRVLDQWSVTVLAGRDLDSPEVARIAERVDKALSECARRLSRRRRPPITVRVQR